MEIVRYRDEVVAQQRRRGNEKPFQAYGRARGAPPDSWPESGGLLSNLPPHLTEEQLQNILTVGALCTVCDRQSGRVHSWYTRTLSNLPSQEVSVAVRPHKRRGFCDQRVCDREIFRASAGYRCALHPQDTEAVVAATILRYSQGQTEGTGSTSSSV